MVSLRFARPAVNGEELSAGGSEMRGVGESAIEGGEDAGFGDDGDGKLDVEMGDCERRG